MTLDPPRARRFSLRPKLLFILLVGLAPLACSENDLRGTYRVKIQIEQARSSIDAILVLGSTLLDTGSLPYNFRAGASNQSGGYDDYQDELGPNSCLILPSTDPGDDAPRSVTFFETRIRGGEAIVPFSIFETAEQRMEVVELHFFANALGGEIIFYEADGERSGRLIGDRSDDPAGQLCVEAMQKFHARIQQVLEAE